MKAATEPRLLFNYGPPPWGSLHRQTSCKYASMTCAKSIALPWVWTLIEAMQDTFSDPTSLLVDIRYWAHLNVGDVPGIPHWHYDCYNTVDDPRSEGEEHRLYIAGAGCQTLFEGGFRPLEGWVTHYLHVHRHRIMPATIAGPRLLVRVSKTSIRPVNHIKAPPVTKAPSIVVVR